MQCVSRSDRPSIILTIAQRLNIYYLILEKMNSFTEEAKYDVSNIPGSQIAEIYEEKRTDAWSVIESLHITKRIVSVCALLTIMFRRAGADPTRTPSKIRTRES